MSDRKESDARYNRSKKGKARMSRWSTSQKRRAGEWRRLRTPGTYRYEQTMAEIEARTEAFRERHAARMEEVS